MGTTFQAKNRCADRHEGTCTRHHGGVLALAAVFIVVSLRANDGRMTDMPYTPGTDPGKFRGVNPVGTYNSPAAGRLRAAAAA
jgi:hypothetical protein